MRWRTTLQNKKILRNTLLNIVTRKRCCPEYVPGSIFSDYYIIRF